jgi:type VI secretion system protein ImpM
VLSPGVIGADGWAGVIMPSVDSVGRYFPLTVVSQLPVKGMDAVTTLFRAHNWYAEVEPVTAVALAPDAEVETFDAQLSNRRFPSELIAILDESEETIPPRSRAPRALWIPLGEEFEGEAGVRGLAKPLAGTYSAWLAEESEIFGRSLMLCEKLPAVEQYCTMLNGVWHKPPHERRSA